MRAKSFKEWIIKAENDVNAAIIFHKKKDFDNSCFHSQQAIEKTLKAAVMFDNKKIIHTHDLGRLVDALASKWHIKKFSCNWDKISEWYTIASYIQSIKLTVSDAEYGIKVSQEILSRFKEQVKSIKH